MKKFLIILATALTVMAFAVSCSSSPEEKAIDLTGQMLNAAKADDVPTFCNAMAEFVKLGKSLSEEELEQIGDVLDEKFDKQDQMILSRFLRDHEDEIEAYAEAHGLELDD